MQIVNFAKNPKAALSLFSHQIHLLLRGQMIQWLLMLILQMRIFLLFLQFLKTVTVC